MKTLNLSLIAALAAAIPAFAQDTPPQAGAADGTFQPKVYGREKYDKLRAKSPFEFEIKRDEAPPAVDPFEGISLTGFVGTDPQKATVYLVNEKDKTSMTVWGNASPRKKTDKSEMTIIAINPGKRRADATVEIERNGQRKTLSYKEGFLSSIKAGPAGGAQPGQPGQLGKPGVGPNGQIIPPTNVNPQFRGAQPAIGGARPPVQGSGAVISGGGNGMNPALQANPALNGGGGNVTISGGGGGGNVAQPQVQPVIPQTPQAVPQVNAPVAGAVISGDVPPAANTAPAINLTQPNTGMAPGTNGNPAQPVRRRVVLPTPLPAPATPAQ